MLPTMSRAKKIPRYRKLANDPATKEVLTTALGKEVRNMVQGGNKTITEGTNLIAVMELVE